MSRPDDLLDAAALAVGAGSGRPRQANLRRAVSTAYYAMFHCLARHCADTLIGAAAADRSGDAWQQVYRSLEHGLAKKQCQNKSVLGRFPNEIEDFANLFVELQRRRHLADYDPAPQQPFYKSDVLERIDVARRAIGRFGDAPRKDRQAFAAFVLFRSRAG